jgi:hypothetical protein
MSVVPERVCDVATGSHPLQELQPSAATEMEREAKA